LNRVGSDMATAQFVDNHPTLFNTSAPLRRVSQGALIGGVCGGLARWLGWDPTVTRFLYVVATVASIGFPGILTYLVLWFIMPRD
jgi:phage shock protein C